MEDLVLAADLGGTNLRMAIVAADGAVLNPVKRPVPRDVSPAALLRLIDEMAGRCLHDMDGKALCGVAFAAPAPAAEDFDGILTKLPNIPTLEGMNLKEGLTNLFGLPVTIENDATAAGIGENWVGASRGIENSVCVTLGTGIGGGVIICGRPVRGKDGIGGEIGHICVEPEGHRCGCGSRGCIEQYASATAIVRMARESGLGVETARDVYDAARAGDKAAISAFRRMGTYLGLMLAGVANLLNPEMLVLAGGVTQGWDAFSTYVSDEILRRAYPAAAARARLVKGELGDNAGILGTARSAFLSLGATPGLRE